MNGFLSTKDMLIQNINENIELLAFVFGSIGFIIGLTAILLIRTIVYYSYGDSND